MGILVVCESHKKSLKKKIGSETAETPETPEKVTANPNPVTVIYGDVTLVTEEEIETIVINEEDVKINPIETDANASYISIIYDDSNEKSPDTGSNETLTGIALSILSTTLISLGVLTK